MQRLLSIAWLWVWCRKWNLNWRSWQWNWNQVESENVESESDLFASREVSFATAQLSNHRLLAAADLTLPNCQDEVMTKGDIVNQPDGCSKCGEVWVAPASASLRPVLLHHLAVVHHLFESLHRAHASVDLKECAQMDCWNSEERCVPTSVMLGRGMFSVAQAILTFASQPLRRVARSVKFFAPLLVVDPWQERAAELPPPDLVGFTNQSWSTAAKGHAMQPFYVGSDLRRNFSLNREWLYTLPSYIGNTFAIKTREAKNKEYDHSPDDPLGSGCKDAFLPVLLLPGLVGRHDPALLLQVVRHLGLCQVEVGHGVDQASVVGWRASASSLRSRTSLASSPLCLLALPCLLCLLWLLWLPRLFCGFFLSLSSLLQPFLWPPVLAISSSAFSPPVPASLSRLPWLRHLLQGVVLIQVL